MPSNITPVAGWPTLTGPAGGDPRTSAAMFGHLQKFANRLARIAERVAGIEGSVLFEVPIIPVLNTNSRFTPPQSAGPWWTQSSITDAGELLMPVCPLPVNGTITEVTAWLEGSGHSALPATKPTLELRKVTGTTSFGVTGTGAAVADASATFSAYDDIHSIVCPVTGGNLADWPYYISFKGEAGANAQTGLKLAQLTMRVTP